MQGASPRCLVLLCVYMMMQVTAQPQLEPSFAAGMHGVELGFLLLADFLDDARPYISKRPRFELVVEDIVAQCKLIQVFDVLGRRVPCVMWALLETVLASLQVFNAKQGRMFTFTIIGLLCPFLSSLSHINLRIRWPLICVFVCFLIL